MVEGGGRKGGKENSRRERECVYMGYQERERESLHAKLRKRMGFSDGLTSGSIARFSRRVSPNNHLMSHNVTMFASSLPIAVSPSISVSHTTRNKNPHTHTHDTTHWLSHDAICKNRK